MWIPPVWQDKCDIVFNYFVKGQLSRYDYVQEMNNLYVEFPPSVRELVDFRKDIRTFGIFCLQVYDNSRRERFLMEQWLASEGWEYESIENYGIANDGRPVIISNHMPDFKIIGREWDWIVEMKYNPCQGKATFKKKDLNAYLDAKASILMIMGNCAMLGANGHVYSDPPFVLPKGLKWAIIDETRMNTVLAKPVGYHTEVGNKWSIQLGRKDMNSMFVIHDWNYHNVEMVV